jgi:hypothetical protein
MPAAGAYGRLRDPATCQPALAMRASTRKEHGRGLARTDSHDGDGLNAPITSTSPSPSGDSRVRRQPLVDTAGERDAYRPAGGGINP